MLKNADFMLGNSSAGIREMPFYGKPTINLGSRQRNRSQAQSIINIKENAKDIEKEIYRLNENYYHKTEEFGFGNSDTLFIEALSNEKLWNTEKQKVFLDIK